MVPDTNDNNNNNSAEEEPRQCRICLEEEEENDDDDILIAPCKCKGSQQWVHRSCLDDWRATNPDHVAFSKCTECLTDYRMVYVGPAAGRAEYCCYVTRDISMGCLLLQAAVLLLGAIVWLCVLDDTLYKKTLAGITVDTAVWWQALLADLLMGFLVLLVLLGIYGSVVLCTNKCDIDQAMASIEESTASRDITSDTETSSGTDRSPRNHTMHRGGGRRRRYSRRRRGVASPQIYFVPTGDDCDCCTDCCHGSACNCHGCVCPADCGCPTPTTDGGQHGDCASALLMIAGIMLLVVGIVLAALGLVFGVILSCIIIRGILARHLFRLQKRQLAQNYVVQDLAGGCSVDEEAAPIVELPPPVPAPANNDEDGTKSSKYQPVLVETTDQDSPHSDYLRKLGLLQS